MNAKSDPKKEKEGNRSLHYALDILEFLSASAPTNISDLSRKLDMNRATMYSLIKVLEARGYVLRDTKGAYYLSGKMLELGSSFYYSRFPLAQMLGDYTKFLIEKHKCCNVSMATVGGPHHATMIRVIPGIDKPDVLIPPGMSVPMHASASGKVLLTYLPIEKQNYYFQTAKLPRFTEYTICDMNTLHAEIKQIKSRGFAVEREEYFMGNWCAAFPLIEAATGVCKASLSVSAPADYFQMYEQTIIEGLRHLVSVVSRFF